MFPAAAKMMKNKAQQANKASLSNDASNLTFYIVIQILGVGALLPISSVGDMPVVLRFLVLCISSSMFFQSYSQ